MANMLVKSVLIYVCMSLFLFLGGVGPNVGTAFIDDLFVIQDDQVEVSDDLRAAAPNVDEETSGVGGTLSFLDVLKAARAFIRLMTGVLFAIPSLFITAGTPFIVQVLVGAPLVIVAVVALVSFARSGN